MLEIMKWIGQDWQHFLGTLIFLIVIGEAFFPLVKITYHPPNSTKKEDE